MQFHCRFARNARFYYVNFNQLQRHSVAGLAATRVRNSKPAMQAFIRLVHEDNFMARLNAAVADPDGEESKLFTKQVLPLLSNFGQTVPYSPSERKDMFPRLVSSSYRCFLCNSLFMECRIQPFTLVLADSVLDLFSHQLLSMIVGMYLLSDSLARPRRTQLSLL